MAHSPHFDYPFGPILDALSTLVGRLILLLLSTIVGISIGSAITHKSLWGLLSGVIESPWILFVSLLFGFGIMIIPFGLILGYLFTRACYAL